MSNKSIIIKYLDSAKMQELLSHWGLEDYVASLHPRHEKHHNLIYYITKNDVEYVLRITYRSDRSPELLNSEFDFINYLKMSQISVAYPIKTKTNSNMVSDNTESLDIICTLFYRAPGKHMPKNKHQYQRGITANEYFFNMGKTMGALHRLATHYTPNVKIKKRYDLMANYENELIEKYIPENLTKVKRVFHSLLAETQKLPRDNKSFGLIHSEIIDSNFLVNSETGKLTLIDFDDLSYSWFMYDIANIWSRGFLWIKNEVTPADKKARFTDRFEKIKSGYSTEHNISNYWYSKLDFFLQLVEMKELLTIFQKASLNGTEVIYNEELNKRIEAIETGRSYIMFS